MTCASSASSIQAKIWKGYAKAASKLGSDYQFYRPRPDRLKLESGRSLLFEDGTPLDLEGGNKFLGDPLFIRRVSLNAEDMNYRKPNKYGKATWYALVDGHGLQTGDYFVGLREGGRIGLEGGGGLLQENESPFRLQGSTVGSYFIAALQPLLPILVVECNRVVSIYSPQAQDGVGAQGYGGTTTQNQRLLVSGVPCSILQGTKGEKSETNLPGDTRSPWWTILMPAAAGPITQDTIITDDLGQRYVVSSNELTDLGFRLTAMMANS